MRNRFQFFRANRFQVSKILTHGACRVCPRRHHRLYGKVRIMNALPSTKWLALGVGAYAIAALACSAEASSPPPYDGPGTTNAGKSNGSGGSGTGLPSAGTTGTGLPTAGTTAVGQGGTTGVGTAGTTAVGTAGTPAAGGQTGGALTSCPVPPAAGAITDLLIDDLEDGDNGVAKVGNRTGFWYTYLDAYGSTIVPKPDATGALPLVPGMTNCHGGTHCIMISGATVAADEVSVPPKYPYAGVGFDLSNAKKPCVYNGSAYSGIKFWARGDVPITIKLNTTATADATGGGTCAAECNGGFSPAGIDVVLTAAWQQIDINFATAKGPTWVLTPKTLDKAALLSLQVQVPSGQAAYSIAIDDITFY